MYAGFTLLIPTLPPVVYKFPIVFEFPVAWNELVNLPVPVISKLNAGLTLLIPIFPTEFIEKGIVETPPFLVIEKLLLLPPK